MRAVWLIPVVDTFHMKMLGCFNSYSLWLTRLKPLTAKMHIDLMNSLIESHGYPPMLSSG